MEKEVNYFHSDKNHIEMIYCHNSNISYPKHNHVSIYTIGLILDGSLIVERNGERAIYKREDLFVIPPYASHSIMTTEEGYTTLSFCIKKENIASYCAEELKSVLRELTEELVEREMLQEIQLGMLSEAVDLLFLSIAGELMDDTNAAMQSDIKDDYYLAVRKLLEKNPEKELRLEELSQLSYTSKYHFIRMFERQNGLTPHQFQIQNRVRKAGQLLLEKHTMTEVALTTGFYDQSHFIKSFKKVFGLSPSEFVESNVRF